MLVSTKMILAVVCLWFAVSAMGRPREQEMKVGTAVCYYTAKDWRLIIMRLCGQQLRKRNGNKVIPKGQIKERKTLFYLAF